MKTGQIHAYPPLNKFPGLTALTSTVSWGDLSGQTSKSSLNQANFFKFLGLSKQPVFIQQVHGNRVIVVGKKNTGQTIKGADGLVTTEPGVALAVRTADCVPVLSYDPGQRILGVAHAGWRGIGLGVVPNMIRVMKKAGGKPANLIVCLGPHLRGCCCEFCSPELEEFLGSFPGEEALVHVRGSKRFLNLAAAIELQLSRLGVKTKNIWISPHCTGCELSYYSARRQHFTRGLKEVLTVGMMGVK